MTDSTPKPVSAKPVLPSTSPAPVATPIIEAPAVATDSRTNFHRQRMQQLEQQLVDAEKIEGTKRVQAIAELKTQLKLLRERESRTYSGADILTPRGNLINADEAIAKRPEFHYRYININAPGKAENAKAMGYERVPDVEGGKQLGDLALFRTSLERRAQIVSSQEHETKRRLASVREELRGEIREMAKFLQSRGVNIDERRLGVITGEE